ncbi:MAG: hypothetical protein ACRC1J_07265, partial [Sandaracinobacteroides sp.]
MADYDTTGMNGKAVAIRLMLLADGVSEGMFGAWRCTSAEGDGVESVRAARPDLLLISADRVTPRLAALLAEPEFAALPLILLAAETDAEAVGLLMDRQLTILEARGDSDALLAAVAQAAATLAGGAADAGSRYDPDSRLAALKRDADRVAAALAEMAGARSAEPVRPVTASRIRAHIKARRQRERFFDAALFADPVWDILLDLSASRMEDRPVSVSSLCIAASV